MTLLCSPSTKHASLTTDCTRFSRENTHSTPSLSVSLHSTNLSIFPSFSHSHSFIPLFFVWETPSNAGQEKPKHDSKDIRSVTDASSHLDNNKDLAGRETGHKRTNGRNRLQTLFVHPNIKEEGEGERERREELKETGAAAGLVSLILSKIFFLPLLFLLCFLPLFP